MNFYLKVLFVVMASFGFTMLSAQIEIREVSSDGAVELVNTGSVTMDVSSYWLCNRPLYSRLSTLALECGQLNLEAGESVTVSGFDLDNNGDELGVYSNSSFGSASGLLDYVIWGSRTGGTREAVAVSAGLWSSGDRADAIPASQSLNKTVGSVGLSAYATGTSTICEDADSGGMGMCSVDGGTITFDEGATRTSICVDGNPDPLNVSFTQQATGSAVGYIITDDANNILARPMAPPFDLDGAGVGTCFIYSVAYEPGFAGAVVGNNISDITGCFDLSEPLTVYREAPDGGMVSLLDGSTNFAQCAGQIVFDVTHENDAQFLSYWYIITDADNNILDWVNSANSNTIDLSSAPAGTCRVWGWSYRGLGDPIIGDPISTLTDDDCEAISDNFITVYREVPDGGAVTLVGGATTYEGEAGNIRFDVTHTTTAPFLSYWYIITDEDGIILGWVNSANSNTIDLSSAPAGTCRIWGWNYRGLADPVVGEPLSTLRDDFCEDISDDFITVIRNAADAGGGVCSVDGGTITFDEGATRTSICVDGNPDPLNVTFSAQATGAAVGYIITDDANNILARPMAPPFDLDGAGVGTCFIYSVAYEPGFAGAVVGNNISDITGCFDLSEPLTVYREAPDGGMVSLLDGSTNFAQCAGQIVFDVTHENDAQFLSYWYIITDADNNILDWVNSANSNTIDLSSAPQGTCRVWGWSYRGLGDPIIGDPISTLTDDDCEAISDNFITVYREVPDGGTVTLAGGGTTYEGEAGNIRFDVTHTTTAPFLSYWYIITDEDGIILGWVNSANSNTIDLSSAPAGICRIWGWNYRGLADPVVGEPLSTLRDDFCEAVSDSFILVTRNERADNNVAPQRYDIVLSGLQETTPTLSRAYGTMRAILEGNVLSLSGTFTGLGGDFDATIAGGAHIHKAVSGRNGGVEFLLTTNISADLRSGTYDAAANTFTLSDEQVEALNNRELYVNIHSTRFPAGELRGQIIPEADAYFIANLLGSNEVPAIQTQASGNLVFDYTDNVLTVSGSFDNLEGDIAVELAGGAHIHDAPNGRNGGVVFPLNLTIDDDNRGAIVSATDNSFTLSAEQYEKLVSQGYYINVHSLVNMPGELRGQIKHIAAASFRADLTGTQEVPAVNTEATGRILVNFDGLDKIVVSGTFNNLSSEINQALAGGIHIHTAPAGRNAGVEFILTPELSDDLRSGVIRPEDNTFTVNFEQASALLRRGMYVNVHSLTNVPGEIRGQLLPLAKNYLGASLDGLNEIQPVVTTGGGHMLFEITDNTLYATGGFGNLLGDFDVNIAGGSHVHTSDARGNGGIALLLDVNLDNDLRGGSYAPMANRFEISDGLRDSLLNGLLYVNLHSTAYPSGELRGQILDENNSFPYADFAVTSPQAGAQITIDPTQSGDFAVTWSATEDPDGDVVVYTWQLASDAAFENLAFQYKVGDAQSFSASYAAIDSVLSSAGLAAGQSATLYHRVLASDGSVSTASPYLAVTLSRVEGACSVDGGMITFVNGETRTSICVDGNPDPLDIRVTRQASGAAIGYIITDDANNILARPMAPPFDLDGAGVGTCFIYSVAYEPGFAGAVVGNNISDITGCFDLSEPLTVYREAPDGGMVSLLDGSTNFAQCAGQIVFDVRHENDAQFLSYWYIITDADNNILDWVNSANSNTIDLSSAPAGTCRVWGWSYRGLGDPIIGDPISTLTDDDCEAISDNFITVYREVPDGGMVSLANGGTSYTGEAGNIRFDVTHTTTAPFLSYWYIITDEDGVILDWVNSANSSTVDLSGAPAGVCRIWGWNYRGLADPVRGESIATLTDDFCEDISTNFIEVFRREAGTGVCDVEAGSLALRDGRTSIELCAADGRPDILRFLPQNVVGNYRLVVTNANDYVIALPSTNAIDVDGMSAGEYRVYVLAFDGVTGVEVGNNISQFGGCFDLSNPFVLDRILCDTACQMPLNLRYTRLSSNRFQVTWDEARDAIGYELLIGLEGESRRFVIPVRRNRVIISTSSTRAIVLRVRTVCSANTRSPYSEYISFRADRSNASARSASTGKVYGDFMIEEPELTVSPNPTADFINLNFESNDAESLLQIYDVTGRVMHSSTIPAGQVAPRISVSDLAEGIYQVVITSDNIMLGQSRFIKM